MSKEITLKVPIVLKSITKTGEVELKIEKLTFPDRIRLKNLRYLPDDFVGIQGGVSPKQLTPLIAGICDITLEQAGEIDLIDLPDIAGEIESFLAASPQIGKK